MIICGGKTFPAHRLVVCPRSEYFHGACCGRFKVQKSRPLSQSWRLKLTNYCGDQEAREPIDLGDKSPVLIAKVLEFLYKGDYTIGSSHIPEGGDPQVDNDGAQGTTTEHTGEIASYEPVSGTEGATDKSGMPNPERTEPDILGESPLTQRPALLDGPPETVPSDQRGSMESIVDPLVGCHPCYIHVRVFGEADYFMISDLKDRAKERFCETFKDFHERQFLAEIIEELYSNRADYRSLRKLVMDVVVDNLPTLWKGSAPAIDIELMKAVPDFATDLCVAAMDKYAVEASNMQPFSTGFRFEGRK